MSDINYEKIKEDIARLREAGMIPPKTPVDYGWHKSMDGSGEPIPDALVWKRRYEGEAETNRQLRSELADLMILVRRLIRRIRNLGSDV